jgi:arylsulfatase A
MLPTVAAITGAQVPNVTIDGMDMSPFLFNDKPSERDHYIYYPMNPDPKYGIFAIRWKQYKAHFYQHGGLCLNTYPDIVCRGNYSMRAFEPPLLYDLTNDPSEAYPLSNKDHSDVMDSIMSLKSQFESTMKWGKSQIYGGDSSLMPCAEPGCKPFPSCCKTPSDQWRYDIWRSTTSANNNLNEH